MPVITETLGMFPPALPIIAPIAVAFAAAKWLWDTYENR
jgi:hypothetical protein